MEHACAIIGPKNLRELRVLRGAIALGQTNSISWGLPAKISSEPA